MTKVNIKLLVFDWDGTLMDSEARIVACIKASIEDLGLPPRDHDTIKNIIGLGLREAVDMLYPGFGQGIHERLPERYRYHFLTANGTPSPFFPGALETLRGLHRSGYLMAVATSKGRAGLDRVLGETGLDELFHGSRCADETHSKPHPRMLLEIIDELGASPRETLMIGDTEYDMAMAASAGARAVAACYGVHARERLLKHNPLACIESIEELAQVVHGINRPGAREEGVWAPVAQPGGELN